MGAACALVLAREGLEVMLVEGREPPRWSPSQPGPGFYSPNQLQPENSVGYLMPTIGGFYGQVMYAMGENASNGAVNTAAESNNGDVAAIRAGWSNGPINVAIAYGATKFYSPLVGSLREFQPVIWRRYGHLVTPSLALSGSTPSLGHLHLAYRPFLFTRRPPASSWRLMQ